MKFVVSSTSLLNHLQSISKVINAKNTLPILDYFLCDVKDNKLSATASDLETTIKTEIELVSSDGDFTIAIEAKRLLDILREFPEQPLTFNINEENFNIDINTENGKYSIVGQKGDDYPKVAELSEEKLSKISMPVDAVSTGINKCIFATADDELRPVMNGIFVELNEENVTFVATDAHKLVRYTRNDVQPEKASSFILPKKPAGLLKNLMAKNSDGNVEIEFDDKNAILTFPNYQVICRLTEGVYPSYNSVIPTDNPNNMTIDRVDFYNTLKRVSVFSNQASNLVKLQLKANELTITAQDLDYSISAIERIACKYDGDELEIGFKSIFLIEIISNIESGEVVLELSDSSRAGLLLPTEKQNENEDVLMLLMPMMLKK